MKFIPYRGSTIQFGGGKSPTEAKYFKLKSRWIVCLVVNFNATKIIKIHANYKNSRDVCKLA